MFFFFACCDLPQHTQTYDIYLVPGIYLYTKKCVRKVNIRTKSNTETETETKVSAKMNIRTQARVMHDDGICINAFRLRGALATQRCGLTVYYCNNVADLTRQDLFIYWQ